MDILEVQQGDFTISTDKQKLDVALIHQFLSNTYWAKDLPLEIMEEAIRGSLCFGIYHQHKQVGFARLITDMATFAYLADVFVVPEYRGQGLSKWLVKTITEHPDLQLLRRWMLATVDAHGLYAQFGFTTVTDPGRFMQKHNPDIYTQLKSSGKV